ncbi:DNA-binding domain of Mlu1-box binding protein MBP1 [Karstenula rhodostoma CBS 690.94]|uniref:DNA-binding domain of Mlu1-box binding protein MBP1 n=1 Tax=Karstenula rhodostoma CBS 690.94 TaxID=1392251 RepID=A0A9P4UJF4_9PLEO|nr:DNA-binding domain of Mlu1-box binding protein MBP1 [Karstenula rhodostoma CBS 690.94]
MLSVQTSSSNLRQVDDFTALKYAAESRAAEEAARNPGVHKAFTPTRTFDRTGQICPAGRSPSVTASLWEDEGTLVFHVEWEGVSVSRREDNCIILGTRLLNVAGRSRGTRDAILAAEKTKHVAETAPTRLSGVWIPFERALELANQHKTTEDLYPLFVHDIGALLYHPVNHTTIWSDSGCIISPPYFMKPASYEEQLARLEQDKNERPLATRQSQEEKQEATKFEAYLEVLPSQKLKVMNTGGEERKEQERPPLGNWQLQDYQVKLLGLGQQNKKRILAARQAQKEKEEAAVLEGALEAFNLEERKDLGLKSIP